MAMQTEERKQDILDKHIEEKRDGLRKDMAPGGFLDRSIIMIRMGARQVRAVRIYLAGLRRASYGGRSGREQLQHDFKNRSVYCRYGNQAGIGNRLFVCRSETSFCKCNFDALLPAWIM